MNDAPEIITIANLAASDRWDVVGAHSRRTMSMGYVNANKYVPQLHLEAALAANRELVGQIAKLEAGADSLVRAALEWAACVAVDWANGELEDESIWEAITNHDHRIISAIKTKATE